jgi:hypothetical protein
LKTKDIQEKAKTNLIMGQVRKEFLREKGLILDNRTKLLRKRKR